MPALKSISGHGSTRNVINYLTKGGRDVGRDYINCLEVGLAGEPVWRQMDETRAAFGNDSSHHGRAARTYEHFVLSPDPRDNVSLDTLREVAVGWADEHFGDYQVAVYYHDDNALGIPHAHVVVNNTNLETGRRLADRLSPSFVRHAWDDLQGRASALGLRSFGVGGKGSGDPHALTAERDHRSKAVREISAGRWSWVEDVRDRVECAARMASDRPGFERACRAMGLEVREAASGDFLFCHPGSESWRVRGGRLGAFWTPRGVERRLSYDRSRHAPKPGAERISAIEEAMASLAAAPGAGPRVLGTSRGEPVTVDDVASMLEVASANDIRANADFEALAASLEGEGRVEALRALRTSRAIGYLQAVSPRGTASWEERRAASGVQAGRGAGGAPPSPLPEERPGTERGPER